MSSTAQRTRSTPVLWSSSHLPPPPDALPTPRRMLVWSGAPGRALIHLVLVMTLLLAPSVGIGLAVQDGAQAMRALARSTTARAGSAMDRFMASVGRSWHQPPARLGTILAGLIGLLSLSAAPDAAAIVNPEDGWGWGRSDGDQTGVDATATCNGDDCVPTPTPLSGLRDVIGLAAGEFASLALKSDGTVWAWGDGSFGQLGDGTTTQRLAPGQVSTISQITAISSGQYHDLALKSDGAVWAWGYNGNGRLGDNTTTQRNTPVQVVGAGGVGTLSNVIAIAAGYHHSLALKSDGTVWAWGQNGHGELGDNSTTSRSTPVQVVGSGGSGTLGSVVAIAGGGDFSLALKADGTVWAWGSNVAGRLGVATSTTCGSPAEACSTTPIQVTSLSSVGAIVAGDTHSYAIQPNGTVYGWGDNDCGKIGDGTTTDRPTPVSISNLANAASLSIGINHALMRQADGTVYGWGCNRYGEIGDGTTTTRSQPVQVTTLAGATVIAAGNYHSLAAAPAGLADEAAPGMEFGMPLLNAGTSPDPVHSLTGAFLYRRTDVTIPGRGPTPVFARSYTSTDTRVGPLGPGWTHNYAIRLRSPGGGSADLLLTGPQGRADRYTYSDGSYTAPAPVQTTLVKHGDGSYTATHLDGSSWRFNRAGSLTAVKDRFGNESTLTYNSSGQLTQIADPAGRGNLTLAYNASGRLETVTDWLSPARVVTYTYDTSGRLWKVTDRAGTITTFGYDGTSSRLTTITDARGHVAVTNTYDANGRVATQKDAKGLVTGQQISFSYVTHGNGTKTTTMTLPATSFEPSWSPTIEDTYDTSGRISKRVTKPVAASAEWATVEYTYDSGANLASVTDARGNTSRFCYDGRGNLTRTILPAPTGGANPLVTLYTYDAQNNPTQIVSPKGVSNGASVDCATNLSGSINPLYATDLAYDANGVTLLSVTRRFTDPDSGQQTAITKFEYDAAHPGLISKVIPPRGNTGANPDYTYATSFSYFGTGSKHGLLQQVTGPLGNTVTFDYDAVGRRTAMVDPLGNVAGGTPSQHTWQYTYDQEDRGRTVTAPAPTAGGQGLVREVRYDAVGNPVVVIDANGQVTKYVYDVRDGLQEVHESTSTWTDPDTTPSNLIVTAYTYDHLGNLQQVTRAQGDSGNERRVAYTYDGLNRVRAETQYPSWPTATPILVTQYGYDLNGNRTSVTEPSGQVTTFAYDPLNRLTGIDYSDAQTPDVTYAYDRNGNRSSMTDGTGTTSYTHDELNRLLAATSPQPGGNKTVGYRYDLDGNRTKLIYPDSTAVTYTFDKAGRLGSLQDWANRTTSYSYEADGRVKDVSLPNGTKAAYSYDHARRLTQVWNQQGSNTISRHTYTLDSVGNRTRADEVLPRLGAPEPIAALPRDTLLFAYRPVDPLALAAGQPFATDSVDERELEAAFRGGVPNGVGQVAPTATPTATATPPMAPSRTPTSTTVATATPISTTPTGVATTAVPATPAGTPTPVPGRTSLPTPTPTLATPAPTGTALTPTRTPMTTATVVPGSGPTLRGQPRDPDALAVERDYRIPPDPDEPVRPRVRRGQSALPQSRLGPDNLEVLLVSAQATPFPADATTWAWGDDHHGQLGDNTTSNRSTPATVANLSSVTAASGGTWHSLVLKSDGTVWSWGYNSAGQLGDNTVTNRTSPVQVLGAGGTGTLSGITQVVAGGSHALALKSDGTVWAWGGGGLWDQLGDGALENRLAPIQVPSLGETLGLGAGNGFSLAITAGRKATTRYIYDRLYRLTGVRAPDGPTVYGYDAVGNRARRIRAGSLVSYAYDRADRITRAGGATSTVDADGNLTARGADTLAYDQANRLTSLTQGAVTSSSAYDGDGTRASTTANSQTTRYVYDVNAGLPVLLDDGQRKYVWGLGLLYAVDGTTVDVYHTDGLGSVRAISDGSAQVVQTYRTDEFGVLQQRQGSRTQPFGYTGEQMDPTGLVYLRARMYDPQLGRFLQRDPVAGGTMSPRSQHRYAYARNNPVNATDPSGLITYFIPGIGGPDGFNEFIEELGRSGVWNPVLFPAYQARDRLIGGLELLQRATRLNVDPDALLLKAQVLRDLPNLQSGEQINFIGYSGGAAVAFDAAWLLQQFTTTRVDHVVTIGGAVIRGKPGNVGKWTSIKGGLDPIEPLGWPDARVIISLAHHTSYFDVPHRQKVIDVITWTGVE